MEAQHLTISPPAESPFPAVETGRALDPGDQRLIDWMLSLSPRERLNVAQGFAKSVRALQNGHRRD